MLDPGEVFRKFSHIIMRHYLPHLHFCQYTVICLQPIRFQGPGNPESDTALCAVASDLRKELEERGHFQGYPFKR
jgi:hypothetical protein